MWAFRMIEDYCIPILQKRLKESDTDVEECHYSSRTALLYVGNKLC